MSAEKSVSGELIRKLRNLKGLQQKAVASNMGKKQQYISKLERLEYIKLNTVALLLTALNSNMAELEKIRTL